MSGYTPTTEDVRTAWAVHHIDGESESPMPMTRWYAEFDRWLSADRARIWAEGFKAGLSPESHNAVNPYEADA